VRIPSLGGHYIHTVESSAGPFDLLLWGVAQAGRWGVQSHRAFAGQIEGGWQPQIAPKLRPWIRGGYLHSSGDKDPNDARHGTFFQVLPTPRPYARFPFFNMMNSEDAFAEVVLRPSKRVTVRSDFHSLRLASANDLWYAGGGAFQPWTFGYTGRALGGQRSLGKLIDGSVDYNVNAHVSVSLYSGFLVGGKVMESIYPKGKNSSFGYVEMTYKF